MADVANGSGRALGPGTFGRRLALIVGGALLLRLVVVALGQDLELLGDGYAYRIESLRLVDDGTVQGPLHPPAWTFVVALPPAVGLRSLLAQQLLTVAIGTAAVAMTGLAARAAFGARTGLAAAAIAAVYPGMWLYERELLSEPLAMLMVATFTWAAYRYRRRPSLRATVGLGALIGAAALTRSELIALALVLVALVFGRGELDRRRRVGWLALAGLTTVVLIAPWTIYNASRWERPVLLSAGLGPAMRAGNCPPTYRGELLAYYEFGCVIFSSTEEDPSLADPELRDAALRFMRERPRRAALVAVARVGRTFNLFRPFQQTELETERGSSRWVTGAALAAYWALLPLAVGGVVLARRRGVPVYPLLAPVAIVVLAVLPTIGSVRYRAPAEVPLVILAAVSVAHLLGRRQAAAVPALVPAPTTEEAGVA